jgi:two-component system, OmpR family, phosphate regulon sensor histidine kinase PhoR
VSVIASLRMTSLGKPAVNPYLKAEVSQLAGILLISASLGYLFDQLQIVLLLGILVYLVKHGYLFTVLANRIVQGQQINYPYPLGLWGLIYQELDKQRNRSRKRKRTLNRYTNRFRKVASAIPDAYVLLDKSTRVEWANLAARHLLQVNWPRDEGVELTKLVANPELTEYMETSDYSRSLEFPSPLNKAIILSLRITPFGSKKNQRLVVTRNITDLYNLNQARRDFVSNVSHELRTPLTVITGFLENLSDNNPQPFQERPFALMLQQAERMNTIIGDLLTLSKLEMGVKPSGDLPVPVPELIAGIIDQAGALAEQKGGYRLEHSVDKDLWLVGNADELQSAFSNLIFNAIIHTPPKTRIQIDWRREEEKAVFTISDSGPGIPERHIPRLTERFYRVDKGRSRQSGGTGLGLAIVKHIINRHEGELIISSKEGYGSQFTCQFPETMTLEGNHVRDPEVPTAEPVKVPG